MESTTKTNLPSTSREEDIDLGIIIQKTGGAIGNIFNWLGRFLTHLGNLFLYFLFFLRRNLVWLVLGLLVGFGYGLYKLSRDGVRYHSEMTVRTNFNSARSLYGSIEFLNSMINNAQRSSLSKIFNISEREASTLIAIEIAPVKSESITAAMYRDQFFLVEKNTGLRTDTFWTKTIKYNDFKQSLADVDYPLHEISVTSTSPTVFQKIQNGLIDQVSQNELLQKIRSNDIETNKSEIELLVSSIRGLDSLREAYNKRLGASANAQVPGNNVYMLDRSDDYASPELKLYDKLLDLKEELKRTKKQSAVENNIIEVFAPFGYYGKQESLLRQSITKYALAGLALSFVVVIFIRIFRGLGKLEKKMRMK